MVRRIVNPQMRLEHAQALPAVQRIFQTLGLAKVSVSATEARELGFLRPQDRIVMNRDHLLSEAKHTLLDLVAEGYRPPAREKLYAAGRDTLAALKDWSLHHAAKRLRIGADVKVGSKLAYILCGGDLSAPQWVDEQYFLDLERAAFVALCQEPKTQQRIKATLETGKPLRN